MGKRRFIQQFSSAVKTEIFRICFADINFISFMNNQFMRAHTLGYLLLSAQFEYFLVFLSEGWVHQPVDQRIDSATT